MGNGNEYAKCQDELLPNHVQCSNAGKSHDRSRSVYNIGDAVGKETYDDSVRRVVVDRVSESLQSCLSP